MNRRQRPVRKRKIRHLFPGSSQLLRFSLRHGNRKLIIVPEAAQGILFHFHKPDVGQFRLCSCLFPQSIQNTVPFHRYYRQKQTIPDPFTHISICAFCRYQSIFFQRPAVRVRNGSAKTNGCQIHIVDSPLLVIHPPGFIKETVPVLLQYLLLFPVASGKLKSAIRKQLSNLLPLGKGQHPVAVRRRLPGKNRCICVTVRDPCSIRQQPGHITSLLERQIFSFGTRHRNLHNCPNQQQKQQRSPQHNHSQLHPSSARRISPVCTISSIQARPFVQASVFLQANSSGKTIAPAPGLSVILLFSGAVYGSQTFFRPAFRFPSLRVSFFIQIPVMPRCLHGALSPCRPCRMILSAVSFPSASFHKLPLYSTVQKVSMIEKSSH